MEEDIRIRLSKIDKELNELAKEYNLKIELEEIEFSSVSSVNTCIEYRLVGVIPERRILCQK